MRRRNRYVQPLPDLPLPLSHAPTSPEAGLRRTCRHEHSRRHNSSTPSLPPSLPRAPAGGGVAPRVPPRAAKEQLKLPPEPRRVLPCRPSRSFQCPPRSIAHAAAVARPSSASRACTGGWAGGGGVEEGGARRCGGKLVDELAAAILANIHAGG